MRTSRSLPVAVLAVVCRPSSAAFFGAARWPPRTTCPEHYRRLHRGARAPSNASTSRGRVRPAGLRRDRRHAARRSIRIRASSIRAATRSCASGRRARYYGLGIQIQAIDGDITVMSIFEGSPAYRKGLRRGDVIARIDRRARDTKGWTSDQAVAQLKGPKGTTVDISHHAAAATTADRSRGRARRGQHPDRSRRVHDRRGDRLHQARATSPRPPIASSARALQGSERQGHEAAGPRPARQPRRSAGSGDQDLQPLPAARAR